MRLEVVVPFDWNEDYVDDDGEIDEERARAWLDEALQLFDASPEAAALTDAQCEIPWLDTVQDYAINYCGVPLARMGPDDLDEILLDVFPRKVSTEPDQAGPIVAQLRAFFAFGKRQFGARGTDALLAALTPELAAEMQRQMADPSNFGMAKSMVMGAQAAGFDTSTEEGMREAMMAYNRSLAAERAGALPAPDAPAPRNRQERREAARRARKARKKGRR